MVKIEKLKKRPDGSEVKIVGQTMYGAGLHLSVDVYVLFRESAQHAWRVASDQPHPDWRTMSVDEYLKHGRSEKLQLVTHGELLAISQEVRRQEGAMQAASNADSLRFWLTAEAASKIGEKLGSTGFGFHFDMAELELALCGINSPQQRIVLEKRFSTARETYASIAAHFGLTLERVRQIESKAFRVLKARILYNRLREVSSDFLDSPIAHLDLSSRIRNCLVAESIYTIRDLLNSSQDHLLKFPNLGKATLREIRERLAEFELDIGQSPVDLQRRFQSPQEDQEDESAPVERPRP